MYTERWLHSKLEVMGFACAVFSHNHLAQWSWLSFQVRNQKLKKVNFQKYIDPIRRKLCSPSHSLLFTLWVKRLTQLTSVGAVCVMGSLAGSSDPVEHSIAEGSNEQWGAHGRSCTWPGMVSYIVLQAAFQETPFNWGGNWIESFCNLSKQALISAFWQLLNNRVSTLSPVHTKVWIVNVCEDTQSVLCSLCHLVHYDVSSCTNVSKHFCLPASPPLFSFLLSLLFFSCSIGNTDLLKGPTTELHFQPPHSHCI